MRPSRILRALQSRGRRELRRTVHVGHAAGATLVRGLKRLPIPETTRNRLYNVLPWRPGRISVPADRLLLGVQNRLTGAQYAEMTGNLLWSSTRVADGPHVALLRAAMEAPLDDDAILQSPYAAMARDCIRLSGQFFDAHDDAGIVAEARRFIGWHLGAAPTTGAPRRNQSAADTPIRVARVRWSDCYQVIDGHHRVARAIADGVETIDVQVKWASVTTALQDLLLQMSWIGGERELYQPVDAPELTGSWTTVRHCTDRLDKMLRFTTELDLPPNSTYLDVASCYGWFVRQMQAAGFAAAGVERDPLAKELGKAVYGLDPSVISTGDAVEFLAGDQRWDVVSCFSLLHHFVLGRGSVSPEEFVRLLDKATARVLFLDTGQEHEEWFETSLAGWTADYIREYLTSHTTFDRIVDLGPDEDARPPYERNYRRHLFACVRGS